MIAWLTKILPTSWILYLWRNLPLPASIKGFILWRGNKRFLVGVLGILQNEQGEVLLLRHTYRDTPWGIPSGLMEYEEPADALIREVREETGLEIELTRIALADFEPNPPLIDLFYLGKVTGGTFRASPEVSEHGFFPVGEWPEGMSSKQKRIIAAILQKEIEHV